MHAEFWKDSIVILDGAFGTVLQQKGLPPGGQPELLNLTDPDLITSVYRSYVEAGSQVVYANTFGANRLKLASSGYSVEEVIGAGVALAKKAVAGTGVRVGMDMGPLGELLEPMGSLSFEDAYDLFREMAVAGAKAGADLVAIETMTDLYETKAALLAVKENTDLPVFVTMSFDENGRTFTGCTISSMARTLEGLGADAIGLNCSLGPDLLHPLLKELCENTRLPVIAKPNAGLPDPVSGHYHMGPEDFVAALAPCLELGVTIFGGCCGTSPEYIRLLRSALEGKASASRRRDAAAFVCTPTVPLRLGGVRVIGERINPTGKKRFQQALLENDLDYILDVAIQQVDAGADILDVNVGYPGVDEAAMLPKVVKLLQSAVVAPLQLDSSNPDALAAGLRVYNGKAAVNSVNGDPQVLSRILPIVKKYGAAVVGLALDEVGIPETAEGRVAVARRILNAALAHGIPKEDVWIDCLTLTVSAQQSQAVETLKAVCAVREDLGLQTVLGVSNISFGLPNRPLITQNFLIQALGAGLTLPIINPNQKEMMDAVAAFRVLSGEDAECRAYVDRFTGETQSTPAAQSTELTLDEAILRGLRADAGALAVKALETEDELTLVEGRLIPALDRVGEGYEQGKVFLPQLLGAAQAAQAVFEVVRASVARKGGSPVKRGKLAVATVRGDIHDIGKNIVKTILENYGYDVIDLGRDVPPEKVADTVRENGLRLVGLSALMTTTLPAMEETLRLLRALPEPPVTFVGGAVVTPEYAEHMGADHYAKDARQSVEIARKVLG
ncbi:Methylmalonyl-CoA mutase domain-containing protein [uncultured Eubacteriales bacterium]|uniref:Methionine synthase n=1 Tax=uncultured Eubacteriales bacterium TaxID=172733 RepID=A0A212JC40_9FIRM|nr:Methylmalonyl-CoA mutase domain-containing protein [uncultured Eubacteriales bacterium]